MQPEILAIARRVSASLGPVHAANGAGKLYELWAMFRLADALRNAGCTVQLLQSDDTPATAHFYQRGSPGLVRPRSEGPNQPSFIRFALPGRPDEFEIHNSVQFSGRSDARHEFDIAIISRALGDQLRAGPPRSPKGHPVFGIECKEYNSDVGIGPLRAMLGAVLDGTHWKQGAASADGWKTQDLGRLSVHSSTKGRLGEWHYALLAPVSATAGARQLAREFGLRIRTGVVVSDTTACTACFQDMATWLITNL